MACRERDQALARLQAQDRVLPPLSDVERVERTVLDALKRHGSAEQVALFAWVFGELRRAAMQVGTHQPERRE